MGCFYPSLAMGASAGECILVFFMGRYYGEAKEVENLFYGGVDCFFYG
jgi:hypothetical protein